MLLLDSQALLWLVDGSPRLGPEARHIIRPTGRTCLGRDRVEPTSRRCSAKRLVERGLVLLNIRAEHDEALRDPELVRHDPLDPLLVAAAQAGARLHP